MRNLLTAAITTDMIQIWPDGELSEDNRNLLDNLKSEAAKNNAAWFQLHATYSPQHIVIEYDVPSKARKKYSIISYNPKPKYYHFTNALTITPAGISHYAIAYPDDMHGLVWKLWNINTERFEQIVLKPGRRWYKNWIAVTNQGLVLEIHSEGLTAHSLNESSAVALQLTLSGVSFVLFRPCLPQPF